jgi:hypothetical protein
MYQEGQVLSLSIAASSLSIDVLIRKVQMPMTLCAVMVVEVLRAPENIPVPKTAILKLYDLRVAEPNRTRGWLANLTTGVESQVHEFSCSGDARDYLEKLREVKDDQKSQGCAKIEDFLSMISSFDREYTAYTTLHQHQGKLIPRLHSWVNFTISQEDGTVGDSPALFNVPGILIEYIDGFLMSDLASNTNRSDWSYLVGRGVKVTGEILNKSSILNHDVRPENMMVCQDTNEERGYRVVMFDFDQCRLRKDDETDEDWKLSKCLENEEGSIGKAMEFILWDQSGFKLNFEHPGTWYPSAKRDI